MTDQCRDPYCLADPGPHTHRPPTEAEVAESLATYTLTHPPECAWRKDIYDGCSCGVTQHVTGAVVIDERYRALVVAAMGLFDPMEHGSNTRPNDGHTVESLCAACVRLRSKRTQSIHRALVALGAMPSVSFRAYREDSDD